MKDDEAQGWIVWVQGDREPEQPFYCEEDAVNRAKEIAAVCAERDAAIERAELMEARVKTANDWAGKFDRDRDRAEARADRYAEALREIVRAGCCIPEHEPCRVDCPSGIAAEALSKEEKP